jgi:hypothetical protein
MPLDGDVSTHRWVRAPVMGPTMVLLLSLFCSLAVASLNLVWHKKEESDGENVVGARVSVKEPAHDLFKRNSCAAIRSR